jgi:hypothetical protein
MSDDILCKIHYAKEAKVNKINKIYDRTKTLRFISWIDIRANKDLGVCIDAMN